MDASVNEASDPVSALPDAGESQEISFESSLEAAFAELDKAAEEPSEQAPPTQEQETSDNEVEESDDSQPDNEDTLEKLSDDVGDDWTPKAASRFKQLKTELKTSKSELDMLRQKSVEYETRIKELSGLVENKDIEMLQQRVAEFEQQQMFSNLEQTSAYQQAVTQPLQELMSMADQIADKYEVDSDALIDVLALDEPEAQEAGIAELLPHASDRDKARLFRIMEEIDPILQRRNSLYENAEAAIAEAKLLEEQRQKEDFAHRAQLRKNITRNVVGRVQEKLPFLSGIENLDFTSIENKAAETDPTTLHPVDHAYNAVSAQLLPTVVREYVAMRKEVDLLTDRLAEYENAQPRMSGASKNRDASADSSASFVDRINAALAGVG